MSKIDKAKEKVAAAKAKIAAKAKKTAKVARALVALFALASVVTGCATADPSSRSTSGEYGDTESKNVVEIHGNNNTVNFNQTYTNGDAAIASADSSGSTETQTAQPTNTTDMKPKTDVNTTGGRTAGVLETLIGSFGTWLATPSGKTATADAAKAATANCADGNCTTGNCTTGNCSDGSCTDGSCSIGGNCSECTLSP